MSILTSPLLSQLGFVEHGFGTRHTALTQDGMASLQQIHSAVPLIADRTAGRVGEGDALLTNQPGITISIRTADCLPILLVDPEVRAIAAVHSGWRGTVAKIVARTLERMQTEYGTDPQRVHAAIGPGIGECCYQVGAEVARRFGLNDAGCVNLAEHNRIQLLAAGVPAENIELLHACTYCDPRQRFWSYRREGQTAGRMISYIALK